MRNILVLAPHTDDAELGCGGTIAKYAAGGSNIFVVAFSTGTANLEEFCEAVKSLGAIPDFKAYRTRTFSESRQHILDCLIAYRTTHSPDVVFCPASDDIHQDHQVISQEALRAFKHSTIYGYECPWNSTAFKNQCYSFLAPEHLAAKINALQHYESQKGRSYFSADFIRSLASVRGVQAGERYAECFEVIRSFI